MPAETVENLVEETKTLIEEVEAGNPDHAAWLAIRDRVEQLAEDRTEDEVGELLSKSRRWVHDVLAWAHHDVPSPFAKPGRDRVNVKYGAKKALRDPEIRKQVIEALTPEERVEVAKAAMEPDARVNRREQKENRGPPRVATSPRARRCRVDLGEARPGGSQHP